MKTIRTNVMAKKPVLPLYLFAVAIVLITAVNSPAVKSSECVFDGHDRAGFCD